jgi:hypothetical protein
MSLTRRPIAYTLALSALLLALVAVEHLPAQAASEPAPAAVAAAEDLSSLPVMYE